MKLKRDNRASAAEKEADDNRMNRSGWVNQAPGFQVGIYGWRKRCLYLLIMGLLVMVIINLALTLWVLKVMEFSSEGMGQLRIVSGGLQLSGQAMVLDSLIASSIRSRRGQPISIESSRNFTVSTRDAGGRVSSRMVLDKDKMECLTRGFQVLDTKGSVLFSANEEEVVVGADVLRVTGLGGAVFDGTVQTPLIRAASGSELKLESPTRSLEVKAPLGIAVESRAGDISASCLTDMKLQSLAGAVRLDSENVYFPRLRKVSSFSSGSKHSSRSESNSPNSRQSSFGISYSIYQLCACENGRLFLAPPHGFCITEDNKICR
ncbi:UNVERIFIED_CONTAM: hypothetical protein PYX00_002673 [Menopon gallinae]|uniref:Delta-sarcoglycan n=1 Tax=Menopon gallinae TaxID=328185 RepID=A0AAW2HYC0_9NEOP